MVAGPEVVAGIAVGGAAPEPCPLGIGTLGCLPPTIMSSGDESLSTRLEILKEMSILLSVMKHQKSHEIVPCP